MAVLGLGVFIRAQNQAALANWYREFLGIDIDTEYFFKNFDAVAMAKLPNSAQVLSIMASDTDYFEPSKSSFMLNLCVDNIDEVIANLEAKGVEILWRDLENDYGKFAHILDFESNKIELWQPPE
ncbi:MAG: bleomycin resistance protein [Hyphomonadaceae bacterium]|nr:MAG: bleomycin resistance protein [Hyphomonadaceae bacterium]KAF0185017.1 MAG: bleomycin resistance protein [Hyphomonadaceae bacterium]